MQSPIQSYLKNLLDQLTGLSTGQVASYIPELTKANPDWFGISLVTSDGVAYSVGDYEQRFTIQSISKPFVYAAALADRGRDFVSSRVGVEPSGDAFNSISLDHETGAPMNPMINAGAIATASLVAGDTPEAQWERIAACMGSFMGREITVDMDVYRSESETGFRNRAIAWMLKNFGIIDGDPMASLENYFRQCSVLVSCQDLAFMAATLANGGVYPLSGKRVLPLEHVERVLSVMASCGMYDYAGSWLYDVGMPAKSGVGGGIIAVMPGRFGIGIFSPPLDEKGNSVRGIEACKKLSKDFHLHVFNRPNTPSLVLSRVYTGADSQSNRQLMPDAKNYLQKHAHRIKYLSLQGFLAVDGVEYVMRRMAEMVSDSDSFILDMHKVKGISESAAMLLNQARANLSAINIAVVFSRLRNRKDMMALLSKPISVDDHGILSFEDNDMAAEWCENRLLGKHIPDAKRQVGLAEIQLLKGLTPELMHHMETLTCIKNFDRGAQILVKGQKGDGRVFFIISGQVSVLVPLQDGSHQRLASLGPGMNFGEMALMGQTTRSASVYADTDVACFVMETEEFNQLAEQVPQVKIHLLENLSNDLANYLRQAHRWIEALA